MHTAFKRFYPSSFAPLFVAWVLSYLVISTGFQLPNVASNAEVTSQSPLAKYVHNTQRYSLRFSETKLSGNNSESNIDADPVGLIPSPIVSALFDVVTAGFSSAVLLYLTKEWIKPNPRGPPSILS